MAFIVYHCYGLHGRRGDWWIVDRPSHFTPYAFDLVDRVGAAGATLRAITVTVHSIERFVDPRHHPRIAPLARIEIFNRRLRNLVEKVAHQDIKILDNAIHI